MTEQKSKIQRGIDYIAKHPGCRTPELAKAMDTKQEAVIPTLQDAIKASFILTCKVTRPGLPPCNEFRLGTACADGKTPDWKVFRISRAIKTLKPILAPVPRAHESKNNDDVKSHPVADPVAAVKAPAVVDHHPEIDIAHSFHAFDRALSEDDAGAPPLRFAIDSSGGFTVARDGKTLLTLKPEETANLGFFMEGTSSIWEGTK